MMNNDPVSRSKHAHGDVPVVSGTNSRFVNEQRRQTPFDACQCVYYVCASPYDMHSTDLRMLHHGVAHPSATTYGEGDDEHDDEGDDGEGDGTLVAHAVSSTRLWMSAHVRVNVGSGNSSTIITTTSSSRYDPCAHSHSRPT